MDTHLFGTQNNFHSKHMSFEDIENKYCTKYKNFQDIKHIFLLSFNNYQCIKSNVLCFTCHNSNTKGHMLHILYFQWAKHNSYRFDIHVY